MIAHYGAKTEKAGFLLTEITVLKDHFEKMRNGDYDNIFVRNTTKTELKQ